MLVRALPVLGLLMLWGCGPHCDNATCPADQVCTSDGCKPALSATYDVTLKVTLAPTEPDGTDWDSAGIFSEASPPDPGGFLYVPAGDTPGPVITFFPTVSDSYQATTTAKDVRFDHVDGGYDGGLMAMHVYDEDTIGTGDAACDVAIGPDAVTVLHAGFWDGGDTGSCQGLSVQFEAQ